ncbi:ATP-binding protein [Nocardiopsis sp. CNS-639]|uniref:ATP-binding protein n=1 Tax=Nocardiopsis sp. CNS-639 TaxID=1169153 RepID=UPI001E304B6C|nr:ATP-binding protein [Nocardiopsis sp. CNS-639]
MQESTQLGTSRGNAPSPSDALPRLPRRIRCADPNTWIAEFGHEPRHIRTAARWLFPRCGSPENQRKRLLEAVTILHRNALAHTASGLPGGTVRIRLEKQPFSFKLAVTDDGPRPGTPLTFPVPTEAPSAEGRPERQGSGLRRLAELALYWEWDGCVGGPVTVWGIFDRHLPPTR